MKRKCKDCKAIRWCIHAFGKYYLEKSGGGEGCNHPLPDDPDTLRRHTAVLPKPDPF